MIRRIKQLIILRVSKQNKQKNNTTVRNFILANDKIKIKKKQQEKRTRVNNVKAQDGHNLDAMNNKRKKLDSSTSGTASQNYFHPLQTLDDENQDEYLVEQNP